MYFLSVAYSINMGGMSNLQTHTLTVAFGDVKFWIRGEGRKEVEGMVYDRIEIT